MPATPGGYRGVVWYDTWFQVLRVVVAASVAYVALVVALRVSGKRTLAKLNAFDFVVTVALGSTLATIALSSDVAIVEGVVAFASLVSLQLVVAWASSRIVALRRAIKSEPTILVRDGRLLDAVLREQRLSADEVRQAVRATGVGGLELVRAVILETDGSMSVITNEQFGSGSAVFADVDQREGVPTPVNGSTSSRNGPGGRSPHDRHVPSAGPTQSGATIEA